LLLLKDINHGFVSYSGLSTWSECPHKFKLRYIDKIKIQSGNIYTHYGKCMHEVMEKHFNGHEDFDKEAARNTFGKLYEEKWEDTFIDPKFHLTEKAKGEFLSQGFLTIDFLIPDFHQTLVDKFGEYDIVGKEIESTVMAFNKINMRGFTDLVIKTKDGEHIGLDYKAVKDHSKWTNPDPSKFHQMNIYTEVLDKQHKIHCDQGFFVIVPRVKWQEGFMFVENKMPIQNTETWALNIAFGIQNEIFFKSKQHGNCFLCEYRQTEHCP